jgi:hypothetical protein
MSETTLVPGQVRPGGSDSAADEATGSGSRTVLLLVGAAAALVVAGIVVWLLLLSGGEESTAAPAAAPASDAVAAPAAPVDDAPVTASGTVTQPRASHAFRDPFKPLIKPAADTGTTADPSTGTPSVSDPVSAPGTAVPGTPATGSAGTGGNVASTKLRLLSVAGDNTSARVSVDGDAEDVTIGVVFADKFKALRFADGQCGTFQFGDERFDLCEGESVRLG